MQSFVSNLMERMEYFWMDFRSADFWRELFEMLKGREPALVRVPVRRMNGAYRY